MQTGADLNRFMMMQGAVDSASSQNARGGDVGMMTAANTQHQPGTPMARNIGDLAQRPAMADMQVAEAEQKRLLMLLMQLMQQQGGLEPGMQQMGMGQPMQPQMQPQAMQGLPGMMPDPNMRY